MRSLVALAALAAATSMPASASAEVISFGRIREAEPTRGEYRKGRRSNYGFGPVRRGGNPAGTKLGKLAAKGLLGKCRIR